MPVRTYHAVPAALLLLFVAGAAAAAERPAPRRLCPEELPEGAHLPPQPGCGSAAAVGEKPRGDGFRDLGNGVSVRIGGRAGAEIGARR